MRSASVWLASLKKENNVYICDDIESPFLLGFFRPKIYIPSDLSAEEELCVLEHERSHIKRLDHIWKPLGFAILSVYWFNPLLWVAYILLCRDIEQSCDEKVISQMSVQEKQGYSLALVSCSRQRRMITVCPVAFGQVSVSTRIKAIVSYKKPSFWIMLCSIVLCAAISVCFLTNPETCLHVYANEVVTPATCTQMGIVSHTCRLCEYTYTEPLAMCSHTYDEGVILQAPTCTAEGSKEDTCTACGAKQVTVLEKLPHTNGELTLTKAASCVDTGVATTACTICQAEYTLYLPVDPNGHSFEETVLRESTCTEAGEGTKTCTLCGHTESVTYELAAHTLYEIHRASTCWFSGSNTWYCNHCNYFYEETLGRRDHLFHNGWCTYCHMQEPEETKTDVTDYPLWGILHGNNPPTPSLPSIEIWP